MAGEKFVVEHRMGEALIEVVRDSEQLETIVQMYQRHMNEARHEGSTAFLKKLWAELKPFGDEGVRDFCAVAGWMDASHQKLVEVLPPDVLERVGIVDDEQYSAFREKRASSFQNKSWRDDSWPRW